MHALTGRRSLVAGGSVSLALAAVHVVVIAIGAPAYRYFGRADLADASLKGSLDPLYATMVVAFTLTLFGLYAFSGAGLVRRLPLLRTGLVTISSIYLLRGLILVLDAARWFAGERFPLRQPVFSAAALAIGVCHAIGTWTVFRDDASSSQ